MARKTVNFTAFLLFVLSILAPGVAGQTAEPASGAVQKVGEHHEVRVVGVRTAHEWRMFPDVPGMPTVRPGSGEVLVIVEFVAKDLRSGEEDRDLGFSDFQVEDSAGKTTKSSLESTDLREIPFSVPDAAALRVFRMGGVAFDIQAMSKKLAKP